MKRVLAMIVCSVAMSLSVTLVGSPARAEGEMSQQRAGAYYLKHACRSAAADKVYFRSIFKGAKSISVSEVKRRLPELRKISAKNSRAQYEWAKRLLNPPADWPTDVQGLPEKLADRNIVAADALRAAGYASSAAEWIRYYNKDKNLAFGSYAAQIRARLELPPPGKGC